MFVRERRSRGRHHQSFDPPDGTKDLALATGPTRPLLDVYKQVRYSTAPTQLTRAGGAAEGVPRHYKPRAAGSRPGGERVADATPGGEPA
jgi:hypothetical protein